MPKICARSRGFVYAVGLLGVTGERARLAATATANAGRLKEVTDLPVLGSASVPAVAAPATGSVPRLADVEKDLILRALSFYKDDKEAAASALGISRRTIYRRLKEYGML